MSAKKPTATERLLRTDATGLRIELAPVETEDFYLPREEVARMSTDNMALASEVVSRWNALATIPNPSAVPELVAAAKRMLDWYSDPDEDPNAVFERIAAEFYRDTGFLRPGKSLPMEMCGTDGADEQKRRAAWEKWRAERSRKAYGDLSRALAALEGGGR